jgi:hypothetical protein
VVRGSPAGVPGGQPRLALLGSGHLHGPVGDRLRGGAGQHGGPGVRTDHPAPRPSASGRRYSRPSPP